MSASDGRSQTRSRTAIAITGLLASGAAPAEEWGDKGHHLVGHVARELLLPPARAAIKELMKSDDLATFALYLDIHKDRLDTVSPGSRDWHYDDIPLCKEDVSHAEYCPGGDCASTQIPRHLRRLPNSHESVGHKQVAIYPRGRKGSHP